MDRQAQCPDCEAEFASPKKKSVFGLFAQKNSAQIAAHFQTFTKSSRFQSEKWHDRVVLKVKIESLPKYWP
jgi:hypothetical protein